VEAGDFTGEPSTEAEAGLPLPLPRALLRESECFIFSSAPRSGKLAVDAAVAVAVVGLTLFLAAFPCALPIVMVTIPLLSLVVV